MLQEIIGCTVNVPGQEAIKSVAVPQFAITLILPYVPPLGLFQLITGDPSHLMLVAVPPLPQVKTGGVIGMVACPNSGKEPQASGAALEELGRTDELDGSTELLLERTLWLEEEPPPLELGCGAEDDELGCEVGRINELAGQV
jgi:hypothetical protein